MSKNKVIGTLDGVVAWYDGTMFDYDVDEMERIIKENGLKVGDRVKLTATVDTDEDETEEIVKEVDEYMKDPVAAKLMNRNAAIGLARHFTKWQMGKDLSSINKSYESGVVFGMNAQKEQMMNEAVEGKIYGDIKDQEDEPYEIWAESYSLPKDKFHLNENVKLVIIKKEEWKNDK